MIALRSQAVGSGRPADFGPAAGLPLADPGVLSNSAEAGVGKRVLIVEPTKMATRTTKP